jgi:hypothetical protein
MPRDLARRSGWNVDHTPAFRVAARPAARLSRIGGENSRRRCRTLSPHLSARNATSRRPFSRAGGCGDRRAALHLRSRDNWGIGDLACRADSLGAPRGAGSSA